MVGHENHYGVDLADDGANEYPLRCESAADVTVTEQAMEADP